jgi:hypothetical protein
MPSERRKIRLPFLALIIFCSATSTMGQAKGQPDFGDIIRVTIEGTPPPTRVKQWFRLIVMAPNPPGGPKLYFMKAPAKKPLSDGATLYTQVVKMHYPILLRAAQSFGCDSNLRPPKPNAELAELPAIRLSVHDGGTTREICQVSYGKACEYLNSIENLSGTDWPKNVHESLVLLRKATHC